MLEMGKNVCVNLVDRSFPLVSSVLLGLLPREGLYVCFKGWTWSLFLKLAFPVWRKADPKVLYQERTSAAGGVPKSSVKLENHRETQLGGKIEKSTP